MPPVVKTSTSDATSKAAKKSPVSAALALLLVPQLSAAHAEEFSGAGCYVATPYGEVYEGQTTSNPFTGSEKWSRHFIAQRKVFYAGPWSFVMFVPNDPNPGRQQYAGGLLENAAGAFFAGSVNGRATFVRPKNNQGKMEISPPLPAKEICSGAE